MKRVLTTIAWLLVVSAVAPPVAAQEAQQTDQEKIAALQDQRDKLTANVEAANKLLADPKTKPQTANALKQQIAKWQDTIAQLDAELAKLRGIPAAGAEAKPLAEDTQKEIAKLRRRMQALVNRIKARRQEIENLPPDEPAAPVGVQPGMVVQPGLPAGPEAGMQPGLPAGMEGMAPGAPAQPVTRRGRLLQQQQQDFAELKELQAKLEELERGPQVEELPEENIAELHPLNLFNGLFEGNPYGLKLGAWGSGLAVEDKYGVADNRQSILIYTDGYYRGGRIDFEQPPRIDPYFDKAERSYLLMDVYFLPAEQSGAAAGGMPGAAGPMEIPGGMMGPEGMQPGMGGGMPAGMPGMEGMQPGMPAGMQPGMPAGMQPGMPAGMQPGMEGMQPGMMPPGMEGMAPPDLMQPGAEGLNQQLQQAVQAKPAPNTRSLRVVLDTDRGPVVLEDFYFDHTYEVTPGWTRLWMPLNEFINPAERTPGELKRITIFGDTADEFYIGMIRFVSDEVPIAPQIIGPQRVTDAVAGEELKLQAVVEAGYTIVDYTWDWGDGTVETTEEPEASHLYVKAGEYTVTLTCKDQDGLKEAGTTQITVVVKPFRDQARPAAAMDNRPMR